MSPAKQDMMKNTAILERMPKSHSFITASSHISNNFAHTKNGPLTTFYQNFLWGA